VDQIGLSVCALVGFGKTGDRWMKLTRDGDKITSTSIEHDAIVMKITFTSFFFLFFF
jgi:hypothetical protein